MRWPALPSAAVRLALAAATAAALSACTPSATRPPPVSPEIAAAYVALEAAESEAAAERAAAPIMASWARSGSATADLLLNRAAMAEGHGQPDRAKRLLDEAIELQPRFAEALGRRAGLAFAEENYAAALADLHAAVRAEPRHFVALAGLGAVYEALNRPKEALDAYRQALKIYPLFDQAKQGEARMARKVEGIET